MKKFNKKSLMLLICVTLLLTFVVSGTVALLVATSDPVTNTFTPVKVDTVIQESVTAGEKSEIKIHNHDGKDQIPVYVRVALSGYWAKTEGEGSEQREVIVRPAKTEDLAFTCSPKWVKKEDGYYYYTEELEPGETTDDLLGTSIKAAAQTDGSYLVVTVVHQAIQSQPAEARNAAHWAWNP